MYAHRAGTTVVNEALEAFGLFAKKLRSEVIQHLDTMSQADIRAFTNGKYRTDKAKQLRDAINRATDKYTLEFGAIMDKSGRGYIEYEAQWMMQTVTAVASGYEVAAIGTTIYQRAMAQPVLGYLFDATLNDMGEATKKRVFASMRSSISNGATNSEILNAAFGTKQFKYADGVTNTTKTSIERTVRTVRNHLANEAYSEATRKLGIEQEMVSATLDFRTCLECAGIDGTVWDIDDPKKPNLPLHPNTRTVWVPYSPDFIKGDRPYVVVHKDADGKFKPLGKLSKKKRKELGYQAGTVKGGTTYKEWFAKQDPEFQKEWLGPSRYKLYEDGGVTIDRFTDESGRTLTLEQWKTKDAASFKRAGL